MNLYVLVCFVDMKNIYHPSSYVVNIFDAWEKVLEQNLNFIVMKMNKKLSTTNDLFPALLKLTVNIFNILKSVLSKLQIKHFLHI